MRDAHAFLVTCPCKIRYLNQRHFQYPIKYNNDVDIMHLIYAVKYYSYCSILLN